MSPIFFALCAALTAAETEPAFRLAAEISLKDFGGIPFVSDLNGDGRHEILWLQSPGIFHSKVFDVPPWQGRFTPEERAHFCLTATDSTGHVLWRIGEPWTGTRPFVTHCGERALDCADIDGDSIKEVVCVRRQEVLLIDGASGAIERTATAPADNAQIVRLAHTGTGATDWTILVKNSESSYPPHEYANPAWFYSTRLDLLKTADYLGAGHAPVVTDLDGDGLDEFLIGYNAVDHSLETLWTFRPVPQEQWDAVEMHVDTIATGEIGERLCVALAASDYEYLLDAKTGDLVWKYKGTHPQSCVVARLDPDAAEPQVLVHNKRADLQLIGADGEERWSAAPQLSFPYGQVEACKRQAFHTFDPLTVFHGSGRRGTDLVAFSDAGWPYVIDGDGHQHQAFPHTPNAAQDWGDAPGRPDDYGYGFYVRVANLDGDPEEEVLISDRRFAWIYEWKATP